MIENQKTQFYIEIIERSHEAFRDFLTHLPEEILNWKITDTMYSVNWIIQHIINDQVWILNVILKSNEKGYHFEKQLDELTLEDLIEGYDEMVLQAERQLSKIIDDQLNEARIYKDYSLSVEDWLFEYIHHLNHHAGEVSFISTAWKRMKRSLVDE